MSGGRCRRVRARGLAIAVALLVLMIVSVVALAIASIGTQDLNLANADRNHAVCRYAAEAAIADGVSQLLSDPAWSAGYVSKSMNTISGLSLTCSLAVTNNYAAVTGNRTAGDGTIVPPRSVYLYATGRMTGTTYEKSAGALYHVNPNPTFKYAAFGGSSVNLSGTSCVSDAFNSVQGAYSSTNNKLLTGCDVATNGTQNGAITYAGGAKNYGVAYGGYGGNASQTVNGSTSNYLGGRASLDAPVVLATPVSPLVASQQDYPVSGSGGNQTLNLVPGSYDELNTPTHATVNFAPGIYYFRVVNFGSQNTINITGGRVSVYVGSTWDSQGGAVVNDSNKPENFQVLGTATCTSVKVTGGNGAYYVVNAPTADVTVQGNSDVYGAVIGKTTTIAGGGSIHYDVDLRNMHGRPAVVSLRMWKRH